MALDEALMRARIMRRVYRMYWRRQLARPALRIGVSGLILVGIASSVSVTHVVTNILGVSSIEGLVVFALSAYKNTSFFVQFLSLGAIGIAVWSLADLVSFARASRVELATAH